MCHDKKTFMEYAKYANLSEEDIKIIEIYLDKIFLKVKHLCVNPTYLVYKLHLINNVNYKLPKNWPKLIEQFDKAHYNLLHELLDSLQNN